MLNDGNYIGLYPDFSSDKFGATSVTFIGYTTAVNSNVVWLSSVAQEGDLVFICEVINAGSLSAPSGWTTISYDSASSNVTGISYYKKLTSSDPNTNIFSSDSSTWDHFMICLIYRLNADYTVGTYDVSGEATTGNPAQMVTNMLGDTPPIIGVHVWMQRGSNNKWALGTEPNIYDAELQCLDENSKGVIRVWHKIYNVGDVPQNMISDQNDNGAQVSQNWYFKLEPNGQRKDVGIWRLEDVYNSKV